MKKINTIGVVGSGTMGSALAQKFAQEGFSVVLVDRQADCLLKGISGIQDTLNEGMARKLFSPGQVQEFMENIEGTTSLEKLNECDLIVEAIYENFDAKCELFKTLSDIVDKDAILATNTSSFSISELADSVSNPERFIGLHYFYHAAKNRLVEIIPGEETSEETYKAMRAFSVQSGKDAITTRDVNGFAVNRFFVPWLNESCKMLEEGIASIAEIDAICMKTFGIGMGPFALMNATGIPVSLHSQRTLEHFGTSYKVSKHLEKQVESGKDWELPDNNDEEISLEKIQAVNARILGCTFFVCSQILVEEICNASDLNRGAKIGLRWKKGPIDLMRKFGEAKVDKFVKQYAALYHEEVPGGIKAKNWELEYVTLEIVANRAIITMSRPEDMNALNEEVMRQLNYKFSIADKHSDVNTIFLIGSGKAFVAGADIKFFVKNIRSNTIDNILAFTKYGQETLDKIDKSSKKVIAILNGLTLGGGMELALCADQILAVPKARIAFPETGIGIYPGLGGTQRLAQKIGKGLAKYLILTGKMLSSQDAKAIGLVDAVINDSEVFDLLEAELSIPKLQKSELSERWFAISALYESKSYRDIIREKDTEGKLDKETLLKIAKTMSFKAPIAMDFAEVLIEEAKGTKSELEKLKAIFTTKDAILGLTSIGKKVEYQGK